MGLNLFFLKTLVGAVVLGALPCVGCGGIAVAEWDPNAEGAGGNGDSGDPSDALACAKKPVGPGQQRTTICYGDPHSEECPSLYEATLFLAPSADCRYIVAVDCGPYRLGAACCYSVVEEDAVCP